MFAQPHVASFHHLNKSLVGRRRSTTILRVSPYTRGQNLCVSKYFINYILVLISVDSSICEINPRSKNTDSAQFNKLLGLVCGFCLHALLRLYHHPGYIAYLVWVLKTCWTKYLNRDFKLGRKFYVYSQNFLDKFAD